MSAQPCGGTFDVCQILEIGRKYLKRKTGRMSLWGTSNINQGTDTGLSPLKFQGIQDLSFSGATCSTNSVQDSEN